MINPFKTTGTYGKGFQPTEIVDQYKIKIYVGGSAGQKTANERLLMEISKFISGSNYCSNKIISSRFNFIPSFYEYIVQFYRSASENKPIENIGSNNSNNIDNYEQVKSENVKNNKIILIIAMIIIFVIICLCCIIPLGISLINYLFSLK